jgi:putative transposase
MSRPLRIEWPGGLYHVTSRGDRREAIVEDDADRRAWTQVLADTCQRFNWRLHAWCLMDNHYHLLVETPDANLSAGMRQLNGVWSQQFNRRHGRVGHVFQGRFKAIMVEREAYLLELARYVVLNPVRAGMVPDAGDHAWSSYRGTVQDVSASAAAESAGPVEMGDAFQPDWLLSQFGATRAQAVHRYVDHVRAGVGLPSVWEQLQSQCFLGTPAFLQEMQARLDGRYGGHEPLADVPLQQQRPARVPLERWAAEHPRDEAMVLAVASGHYRQAEVARFFGVSDATVSRLVRRDRSSAAPDADRRTSAMRRGQFACTTVDFQGA